MNEKAREIIKHISDAALELAFVRHDLTSDQVDVDEDADVKTRVEAHKAWLEDVKRDVLNCLTGDDTGCLDPEELDETNCELLWLESALSTARKEEREAAFKEAVEIAKGELVPEPCGETDSDFNAATQDVIVKLEAAASTKGENDG